MLVITGEKCLVYLSKKCNKLKNDCLKKEILKCRVIFHFWKENDQKVFSAHQNVNEKLQIRRLDESLICIRLELNIQIGFGA